MATQVLLSRRPVAVEVSYDLDGLTVGMKAYRWNGSTWTQEGAAVLASPVGDAGTYVAIFAPQTDGPYMVEMMPYQDPGFMIPLDGYFPSSRTFLVDPALENLAEEVVAKVAAAFIPANVTGTVDTSAEIKGYVTC